jgi:hypothetical protein
MRIRASLNNSCSSDRRPLPCLTSMKKALPTGASMVRSKTPLNVPIRFISFAVLKLRFPPLGVWYTTQSRSMRRKYLTTASCRPASICLGMGVMCKRYPQPVKGVNIFSATY